MNIIDTHTHIYSKEFDADRAAVIEGAKSVGVKAVILPNEDTSSIDALLNLCDKEPDFAFPLMGLHPTSIKSDYINELSKIETTLSKHKFYGIGEIGLDFYKDTTYKEQQINAFETQLRWSAELELPVSIHSRAAMRQVIQCINNVGTDKLKGVFHCFGGTIEELNEVKEIRSFVIGIGGVITFKHGGIAEIIENMPLERIVVETDAPYLAPVPYRGKRNEPAYIFETIKKIAECYKMTTETAAAKIFETSMELFDLSAEISKN